MAKQTHIQTAFNAGEWSPLLYGRIDNDRYRLAVTECKNFLPILHGPIVSRPGTRFIAECRTGQTVAPRLIPFVFSTESAYMLEMGHQYVRFFKNQAPVRDGTGGAYEIPFMYQAGHLDGISYAQCADVMYFANDGYPPAALTRKGDANWSGRVAAHSTVGGKYYEGPFLPENVDNSKSMKFSSVSGSSVTVEANADIFTVYHVGSLWRVKHPGQKLSIEFNSNHTDGAATGWLRLRDKFFVSCTAESSWRGRVMLQQSYDGDNWQTVASFTTTCRQEFFESQQDGMYYRFVLSERGNGSMSCTLWQDEHWGSFFITAVVSPQVAVCTVLYQLGAFTSSCAWREGAWSNFRGYPQAVWFADDRLCFGGTKYQPYTRWRSWVGDYENFLPGDTDDAADTFTFSEMDGRIQWGMKTTTVLVGSMNEEATVTPGKAGAEGASNPPTVKVHTNIGCGRYERPVRIGDSILFIDRSQRHLMDLSYNVNADGLTDNDLSVWAEHLLRLGITQLAYQRRPHSVLWAVRSDGMLLSLTYHKAEQQYGWAQHPRSDGWVQRLAVIPSSLNFEAGSDQLWMISEIYIAGQRKYFVEVMQDNTLANSASEFWCLDFAEIIWQSISAGGTYPVTHLEGKTVAVMAAGVYMGTQEVAGGCVTANKDWYGPILIGMPYTCRWKAMRPEAGSRDGTAQGRLKKAFWSVIRMYQTFAGRYGWGGATLRDIPIPPNSAIIPVAGPELYTGDVKTEGADIYDRGGQMVIEQTKPYPMTILAVIQNLETNDE